MNEHIPTIIITGASGFIGSNFLDYVKDRYRIHAIARRSQSDAGVPSHKNIKWHQVNISNWTSVKLLTDKIRNDGGADFIYHLAGYYDFSLKDNPEYELTNVEGTRNILVMAKELYVRRFIFASSLAICKFFYYEGKITERSAPDADHPYAVSKRKAEEIVKKFSTWVPSSIVRFAAVFSDWCQYPPLYIFLITWLSKKWNSRIIAGRGRSAISYIHINDLNNIILAILEKSDDLAPVDTYVASPDGCNSHRELFELATGYYYGRPRKPFFIPKFLAYPGVLLRETLGNIAGDPPFEKTWMVKYIDHTLIADSSYTRAVLGWEPDPNYSLARRLLFLIEKMKMEPGQWLSLNKSAMERISFRPVLMICDELAISKGYLTGKILEYIMDPANGRKFICYQKITGTVADADIGTFYDLLMTSIQARDRAILLNYLCYIGIKHFDAGLRAWEIGNILLAFNDIIVKDLLSKNKFKGLNQDIHDLITMMIYLNADEIIDIYIRLSK